MPDNSTANSSGQSSSKLENGVEREAAPVNPTGNPSEKSFRFLPPPQTPAQHLLRAIVIGLGVVMILMFAAVVVGIAIKISHHAQAPKPATSSAAFAVPKGAKIEHMQVTGDRLILRLKTDKGEEVDIVDTKTGRLVSQVKTPPDVPSATPQNSGP